MITNVPTLFYLPVQRAFGATEVPCRDHVIRTRKRTRSSPPISPAPRCMRGHIDGRRPRAIALDRGQWWCASATKRVSHQIFLEPEGLESDLWWYPLTALSTSLPGGCLQGTDYVRSIAGLEHAEILAAGGYAIEYGLRRIRRRWDGRALELPALRGSCSSPVRSTERPATKRGGGPGLDGRPQRGAGRRKKRGARGPRPVPSVISGGADFDGSEFYLFCGPVASWSSPTAMFTFGAGKVVPGRWLTLGAWRVQCRPAVDGAGRWARP